MFLFILYISTFYTQVNNLDLVRNIYFEAIDNEYKNEALLKLCKNNPDNSHTAYYGVALALKAKFIFNPVNKIKFFNEGTDLIEKAIANDFNNIELRFLRLTIQEGSPSILGYKGKITTDKLIIKTQLESAQLPSWFKKKINEYLN